MLSIANIAYRPACSMVIANQHIPSEAACVHNLSLKYLCIQYHLTLSFDDKTIKQPKSVYIVYFTAADG